MKLSADEADSADFCSGRLQPSIMLLPYRHGNLKVSATVWGLSLLGLGFNPCPNKRA